MDVSVDLGKYLASERIACDIEISSRKKLFEQLAAMLAQDLADLDAKGIFRTLVEREKLGSTGIGDGMAIPHGRIAGLTEARIAIVRMREPIEYGARDGKSVALVFALLVPEDANEEHLHILAVLARKLSDEAVRKGLELAQTNEQVIQSLCMPAYSRTG